MDDYARSFLKNHPEGVTLAIKVKPRSSKNGPDAVTIESLEWVWRLQSAPVDGKANAELIAAVAKYFDIPKSKIELVIGEKSKSKVLLLRGIALDNIMRRIT